MCGFKHRFNSLVRLCGAGALAVVVGCQSCGPPFGPACADIPPGAIPRPSGSYACQWQSAQAERAEADDFVLYQNEWEDKSAQLAPCGRAHLEVLSQRLQASPLQVLIQQSANSELDRARQATAIEYLAARGVTSPGERVVVGCPEAEGLYGFEAPRIVRGYSESAASGATGGGISGRGRAGSTGGAVNVFF